MDVRSFLFVLAICLSVMVIAVSSKKCIKSLTTVGGHETDQNKEICSGDLIFADNFDYFDLKRWTHERTLAGGGNWEFQWYTNNRSNSYAKDGKLHIRPTFTVDDYDEDFLTKGTIDLNGAHPTDTCTNPAFFGCTRTGNAINILNPIKSARISTWESFFFKYGKLQAFAKLPVGDWLWPAIWLRPRYNWYGETIASGEIDVMEARGNRHLTSNGKNIGIEQTSATLHWGPDFKTNAFRKTSWTHNNNVPLSDTFHLYEFTWKPDLLEFAIDGVVIGSIAPITNGGFWRFGNFSDAYENPWRGGTETAPFDQEFYILINLAVGGVGYFPDDAENPGGKPWKNDSPKAATDFWNGRDQWRPTWQTDNSSIFQIDYVKVYAL